MNLKKIFEKLSLWFFIFLGLSLFFGDGQQPLINIISTLFIFTWTIGLNQYCQKQRQIPNKLFFIWSCLIVYNLFLIPFSIDAGYSITAFIRLNLIFLTFKNFYEFSHPQELNRFIKYLFYMCVFAVGLSVCFLLFPNLKIPLPVINLVYANFGHNFLSSLLLFILPFIVLKLANHYKISRFLILLILTLAIIFSFSRIVITITGLFFIYVLLNKNIYKNKQIKIILTSLTILLSIFVVIWFTAINFNKTQIRSLLSNSNWLTSQIVKSFSINQRTHYWIQALDAYKTSPIVGYGPGTFSLLSLRFQKNPNSSSFYSHSRPLEILSETGTIGIIIYLILLIYVFYKSKIIKINRNSDINYVSLGLGLVLVFINSWFDYNLSFLVIEMLFWSGCAVLLINSNEIYQNSDIQYSLSDSDRNRKSRRVTPIIAFSASWRIRQYFFCSKYKLLQNQSTNLLLILLLIFYSLSILSIVTSALNNQQIAFYLTPFNIKTTQNLIVYKSANNIALTPLELQLINIFHRQNPNILSQLANTQINQTYPYQDLYVQAVLYDPKNLNHYDEYLNILLKQNNPEKLTQAFIQMNLSYFHETKYIQIQNNLKKLPINIISQPLFDYLSKNSLDVSYASYLSKMFYNVGLNFIISNTKLSEQLWILARDLRPNLSFYHIELASLYKWKLNQILEAKYILKNCLLDNSAKNHCQQILNYNDQDLNQLSSPGSYLVNINNFHL